MITGTWKLPPALASALQKSQQRWDAFAPREQRALLIAAAAAALLLVWTIAVQPALRTLRTAPLAIEQADFELQSMQRLAVEGRTLKNTPLVSAAQAGLALRAATERLGDKAKLLVQGDRATLTVNGVDAEALRAWLTEARGAARAHPLEAQLARGPTGYTGTLVVGFGSST